MITVFTPTYNRKKLLERFYISLKNQTKKDFKWLIIDDGSTDNTKALVETFIRTSPFEIRYVYQENGGKARAHNRAVKECDTEFFLILDSDDCLSENCIGILEEKAKSIQNQETVAGILGNRFDLQTGKCIGTPVPNLIYSSGLELYQKLNFTGDTLRLYKTDILKKYLFPEVPSENFIFENVVFDRIDRDYKLLLVSDKLYYCEYQEQGYSSNIDKYLLKNPIGYSISLKSSAENALVFRKKINYTILYMIWCKHFKIEHNFLNFKNKLLYIILLPIVYIFDIIKYPDFFYKRFEKEV